MIVLVVVASLDDWMSMGPFGWFSLSTDDLNLGAPLSGGSIRGFRFDGLDQVGVLAAPSGASYFVWAAHA
jgi:hypothetical protein